MGGQIKMDYFQWSL